MAFYFAGLPPAPQSIHPIAIRRTLLKSKDLWMLFACLKLLSGCATEFRVDRELPPVTYTPISSPASTLGTWYSFSQQMSVEWRKFHFGEMLQGEIRMSSNRFCSWFIKLYLLESPWDVKASRHLHSKLVSWDHLVWFRVRFCGVVEYKAHWNWIRKMLGFTP